MMKHLLSLTARAALPKLMRGTAVIAALSLGGITAARAQADLPETDSARDSAMLVGSWEVTVTPYNCKTGVTLPPFQSLLGFLADGVEIETTSNPALQPGQRTPAFGTWTYAGQHRFALKTEAFILFPAMTGAPIPRGKQFISQAIRLTTASSFESVASIAYTTPSEQVVLTGCARAVAHRL